MLRSRSLLPLSDLSRAAVADEPHQPLRELFPSTKCSASSREPTTVSALPMMTTSSNTAASPCTSFPWRPIDVLVWRPIDVLVIGWTLSQSTMCAADLQPKWILARNGGWPTTGAVGRWSDGSVPRTNITEAYVERACEAVVKSGTGWRDPPVRSPSLNHLPTTGRTGA